MSKFLRHILLKRPRNLVQRYEYESHKFTPTNDTFETNDKGSAPLKISIGVLLHCYPTDVCHTCHTISISQCICHVSKSDEVFFMKRKKGEIEERRTTDSSMFPRFPATVSSMTITYLVPHR